MTCETVSAGARRRVEIMDTTLRDGEQTQGVAMSPQEKLTLAQVLLARLGVDRIEVASARVSSGEQRAVTLITAWAKAQGRLHQVEALGFCDGNRSADWLGEAGCQVMNLLAKGSFKHLDGQLRKTPEQHLADIARTVEYCNRHGIVCNCYPEDWSQGMREDNSYARWILTQLVQLPIQRIMLPDTLGICSPEQVNRYLRELVDLLPPATHLDFHAHNDYGLATANTLAAVNGGAAGVHVTVNGLGERAGNAPLDEVAAGLRDLCRVENGICEGELVECAKMVEIFSGRRLAPNKPISGDAVFTQTAGIHADGDKKGKLYVTELNAERFKRTRTYALGKLAGKASLDINLDRLGLQLSDEQKKLVLERIICLGDQKRAITEDDLPFIISDVLKSPEERLISIEDCVVTTTMNMLPTATIKVRYLEQVRQASATGDGGYDAFMKALRSILQQVEMELPQLVDYEVHIPPGGKTDALVQTTITWEGGLRTRGVDSDQLLAAIDATEHMLNLVLRGGNANGRKSFAELEAPVAPDRRGVSG